MEQEETIEYLVSRYKGPVLTHGASRGVWGRGESAADPWKGGPGSDVTGGRGICHGEGGE